VLPSSDLLARSALAIVAPPQSLIAEPLERCGIDPPKRAIFTGRGATCFHDTNGSRRRRMIVADKTDVPPADVRILRMRRTWRDLARRHPQSRPGGGARPVHRHAGAAHCP